MKLSLQPGKLAAAIFAIALAVTAAAQAPGPNQTEWENETPYNLRLFYPNDLKQADAAQVMSDGHLALFGISGASDPKLAEATRCLRPILLLTHPASPDAQTKKTEPNPDGGTRVTITPATTATLLLAELDVDCLTPEQQNKATNLLSDMAEIVDKVPGMTSIAKPSTYTIGYQTVHMSAAQGQPQASEASAPQPGQLFTMGISTNWNSHLLVWYFSSNSIETLNRITKTTVRFGRAQAAPLYPVTIGSPQ